MTAEQPREPSRLESAVARAKVPEALRRDRGDPDPVPASGQIWRADWNDEVLLVVVVGAGDLVASVPLTFDIECASPSAVVIEAATNPLGVTIAAWPQLRRDLPAVVFAEFFGQIEGVQLAAITASTQPEPSDETVDPMIRLAAAMLEDSIEALASVRWHAGGTGELRVLLGTLTPALLVSTLGVTPQRALALRRGIAILTPEEASLVAPSLGRTVEELLAGDPSLPSDLVERLEQPGRHRQLRRLADLRTTDLSSAYRDVATSVWALAARQTGEPSGISWDGRIDAFLGAVLSGKR